MEDEDYWYNDDSDDDPYDEDDEDNEDDTSDRISDADVFSAALCDSDSDKFPGNFPGGSYGHSIDLDKLTDEQRDLYDSEYYGNIDNRIDDNDMDF